VPRPDSNTQTHRSVDLGVDTVYTGIPFCAVPLCSLERALVHRGVSLSVSHLWDCA